MENRRFTLLHYLAEIVEEKMTHLAMWQNDLKDLEMAAKGIALYSMGYYTS